MNILSFAEIYKKCLREEKSYNPQKPIASQEEFNQALWYICSQFQQMANLLRSLVSEKLTEASLNNNFISDGLKQYSKTTTEIRECQENINGTITAVRRWLLNNSTPMNPDSPIFDNINNWTDSIIKFANSYNKYNKNNLLPSIKNDCQMYAGSINTLNELIDDLNGLENAQHIDYVINLPDNLTN